MDVERLVDREAEAAQLRELCANPPSFIVLRGRRRMGKSFLLSRTVPRGGLVSYQADQLTEADHLAALSTEVGRLLPGRPPISFDSWDDLLSFLPSQAAAASSITLLLDEFQYLVASQPALPSILQRHWDRWQREALRITLILSGSALSLMEQLLHHGSPLFGRADYRPLLGPLTFRDTAAFAGAGASPIALLERFAVVGGTPQYQRWAGPRAVRSIIRDEVLRKGRRLYEEPLQLLRGEEDVRSPGTYFSILKAIGAGRTRTNEIAEVIGQKVPLTVHTLNRLEELGYVELREPLTQTDRLQTNAPRRGIWRIADEFFRFWFRYVFPKRSALDRGDVDEVEEVVSASFDHHVATVFEDCCREWLWRYRPTDWNISWQELGSWWSRRGDVEIDIVGMRQQRYTLVAECKWSRNAVGVATLDGLYERRAHLGGAAAQARLAIFARAGFTDALRKRADKEKVILVSADDLFR
jgi:AAA+ ATPase superfamily predicted ATPase